MPQGSTLGPLSHIFINTLDENVKHRPMEFPELEESVILNRPCEEAKPKLSRNRHNEPNQIIVN